MLLKDFAMSWGDSLGENHEALNALFFTPLETACTKEDFLTPVIRISVY
jgi:hypothetical protein